MSHQHQHFIVPVRYYVWTLISLLVLTVITVLVAQFNFGKWNIVVAMAVAIVKASLVGLFFMGLRWDKKVNAAFFVSSFLFLGIFLGFSAMDISTRSLTDKAEGQRFGFKTPVKLIKTEEPLKQEASVTEKSAQAATSNAGEAVKAK